jgi:hypothetical protein
VLSEWLQYLLMKIFIITNFRIDSLEVPGEMLLDDLSDIARDNSTYVELDLNSAIRKMSEVNGRFLYTVIIERTRTKNV